MTDTGTADWTEIRRELQLNADLFQIDCERRELQRRIDELDEKERRVLGLK